MYSPDIFGIVETWLDDVSVKHLTFSGYALVHRRDRPGAAAGRVNHGGVVLFRRCHSGAPLITFLEESTAAERIWTRVETDLGPFLLGLWYRPPGADDEAFLSLEPELARLGEGMLGVFLCGDFNIRQRSWLRYSPCNTPLGSQMQALAHKYGLKQFVKDPTHIHGNLLDVVLSSLPFHVECSLTPRIADHNGILTSVDVPLCTEVSHRRIVWDFKHADWDKLKRKLRDTDWGFIHKESVDDAARQINDMISGYCSECIPKRELVEKRKSHPWMTDACVAALREKAEHENSEDRGFYVKRCGEVIEAEFANYVNKTKHKLSELEPCSRLWWRVSGELLDNVAPRAGLPSLRALDGTWLHEPAEKANLFAGAFSDKFTLPPDVADIEVDEPPCTMNDFVPLRCRSTRKILNGLREDQATGPDMIAARVLRRCAEELTYPVTLLARRILDCGRWPSVWKLHWISPLHKRGSVFDPDKYRGLHLTPVLSKVVERIFASVLVPFFASTNAFGRSQWAFQKKIGCNDLVCLLVNRWLLAFQERRKVGIYLSDISGAFDRVERSRICRKLRAAGLNRKFLNFFMDFLDVREAVVVVNGSVSDKVLLQDMVFQGTVLGPYLWNVFFRDVSDAVASVDGLQDTKFADDLSASKEYPTTTDNVTILNELRQCQSAAHAWGDRNRVAFDPSKEEFCVLDAQLGHGRVFRLLGPMIDNKLRTRACVDKVYKKAKPKVRRLLRARRFFSTGQLVLQFKSHIWGVVESVTSAVYHAAPSVVAKLDRIQESFVEKMSLSERDAFLRFGLHPLKMRRDISMLGMLYKCAHGIAHADLCDLFPRAPMVSRAGFPTRVSWRLHSMQLLLRHHGVQRAEFHRSLFGLVKIWNVLPNSVVTKPSVSSFQSAVMEIVKRAVKDDAENWQAMLSPPVVSRTLLRYLSVA